MTEPRSVRPTSDGAPSGPGGALPLEEGGEGPRLNIRIGRYQLVREIGSGGMGTVFEAVQDRPRRSVAMKLMRGGLGSTTALRRFEFESQLLARLRHPGIAQVFDAGTHRQGQIDVPFYVMEYIPGARSLTDYADSQKLTIRQRLELFAGVCDAIHYAHERGIIHRDIKPGNILVDTGGQAKLIDFGVARADDAERPTLQTSNNIVGTLQYMSPEQCDEDPMDVDPRTDIYALGVVLYELVCGRLPYEVSRANLLAAAQTIREQTPIPPRRVRPELGGDLEVVILTAIHKDRQRRYRTAKLLAADVRNVLKAEPIDARRDSATYVLRKRARALVAAHRVSTWLVTTMAAFAAACAIALAIRAWPPMTLLYERTVTSRMMPASKLPQMSFTRMIALNDGTDFEQLARSQGVSGFRAQDNQTLRLLHALLFERLALARARVLVVDIGFTRPPASSDSTTQPATCAYEDELLRGITALKNSGCQVVLGAGGSWTIGPDGVPESMWPRLANATHWGFNSGVTGSDAPWSLDLILQPKGLPARNSMALAACAAYWHPGYYHRVEFDADRDQDAAYAKIYYLKPGALRPGDWNAPTEPFTDRVRLSQRTLVDKDDPQFGRRKDDLMGHTIVHIPADEVANATFDYAQVLTAESQKLRQWFQGKVVVLGDGRRGRDGPHPTPDLREYGGFVLVATAIDSILRSTPILAPTRVTFLGMAIFGGTIFGFLGTVGGSLIALSSLRARVRRIGLIAAWSALIVVISLLLYRYRGLLYDPTVAVLGAFLAAEAVSLLCPDVRDRLE